MAKVTEITVWTRGVVMDKEARDVANAFAQAAKMEGKFVQAFDNYEDLPDRVLVTTRKYARISDEEIEMKYLYTNAHPDVVVIVEPKRRVYPSGADSAAATVPIMVLAPGLFTTTMGLPRYFSATAAKARPWASCAPPGAWGFMMVMARSG